MSKVLKPCRDRASASARTAPRSAWPVLGAYQAKRRALAHAGRRWRYLVSGWRRLWIRLSGWLRGAIHRASADEPNRVRTSRARASAGYNV
jgi:hypothetical protein